MTRGQRLRAFREGHGLRQGEVARRIGVGRTTIVNIEADKQGLTARQAIAFADLYGLTLDYLLGRADINAS